MVVNCLAAHEFVLQVRQEILELTQRRDGHSFFVAQYSRSVLGQTGDGHFSPIGGYNVQEDMVLVFDVARFKYPPHWVKLPLLVEAMCTKDASNGRTRGYAVMSRRSSSELNNVFDLSGVGRIFLPTIPPAAIADLEGKLAESASNVMRSIADVQFGGGGDVEHAHRSVELGIRAWLSACQATPHPVLLHFLAVVCVSTPKQLFLEILPNAGPAFAAYDHIVANANGVPANGAYDSEEYSGATAESAQQPALPSGDNYITHEQMVA